MKKTLTAKILSLTMCLFLLVGHIGILSVLPSFITLPVSAAEDVVAAGKKLQITLKWKDGTNPDSAASATTNSQGKATVVAVISVGGDSSLKGKTADFTVSAIDLSARAVSGWSGKEYNAKSQTFTAVPYGESREFEVEVYNMKKYNSSGTMDDAYPVVAKVGGFVYRHQVGIQIVSHSDNAVVNGTRTLRAYVNNPGNRNLETTKNTSIGYYPTASDGMTKVLHDSGYSYKGAAENKEVTSYDVRKGNGDWDDGRAQVSGSPGGSGFQLITSDNRERAAFYFKAPYAVLRDSAQHKILLDNFSGLKVYISGNFRVHKQGGGDNNDPLAVKFGYGNEIDPTQKYDDHRNIGNNSYKDRKLIHWFPTGDSGILNLANRWSTTAGAYYSGWKQVSDNGQGYAMWARNEDGQSGNNRVLFNINMGVTIVKDNDPTVSEIYVSQSKSYAGASEDIYLMVRMSEPIQLYPRSGKKLSDFTVRAQVYDGNTSSGSMINFRYVDGNYTDTLIFKAELTADKAQNLYGNQLRISDIEADDSVYAADLFIDGSGMNNKADFSKTSSGGSVTGMMIDIQVDSRVPKIEWDSSTTVPTSPVRSFAGLIKITNMASGGTVKYAWSTQRDINSVPSNAWKNVTALNFDGTTSRGEVQATGLNGDHYLHVIATGKSGVTTYKTFTLGDKKDTTIRFDNTAPIIAQHFASGIGHNKYQDVHTIGIYVDDPQASDSTVHSKITKVWYYVKDASGKFTTDNNGVQIYGKGDGTDILRYDAEIGIYTMNLTAEAAGVPEGTYGAYTVYFMAEDEAGNRHTVESAWKMLAPLMFDRREKFTLEYTATYGMFGEVTAYPELGIPSEHIVDGYDMYYNSVTLTHAPDGTPWNEPEEAKTMFTITSAVAGSVGDSYSLYSIMLDGEYIYDKTDGGWQDSALAAGATIRAEDGAAIYPGVIHVNKPGNNTANGNRMFTLIQFDEQAAGRFDFVFLRENGSLQSEILTVYITPQDAKPPNYATLYDEERLLVNKVWQFTTGQYYSGKVGKGVPYDGTMDGVKPIFSSYEKALEYARFMEAQDLELLYLDGSTDSNAIANYLNSGFNPTYMKAGGETVKAAAGQTWIRYKSQIWTPENGATSSYWVYYYYDDGHQTKIETDRYTDFTAINPNLEKALQNNAEDIAGKGGDWTYLTKNAGGSYTDAQGQPTYSRSAVFFEDVHLKATESNFRGDLTFTGDTAIVDGTIDYTIGAETASIPLVGNHTFSGGEYAVTYYRPYTEGGGGEWTRLEKGSSLRSLGESGVYEFKEIGGGFRHYYLYCDFDAPLLHYNFVMSGQTVDSTAPDQYFSQAFNGNVFQAKSLTLKYIFDAEHALPGAPVELDRYSYVYLMRSTMGGLTEELHSFYTLEDLLANEQGVLLPDGQYVLYVFDRLGNSYSLTINTNGSPLIAEEPVLVPNTSVTFYINREKSQIAEFSVTRQGASSEETDTEYAKTKTYVKSGVYTMWVKDIFGNTETRTITLDREPPSVRFYYKDGAGQFREMQPLDKGSTLPQSTASVQKNDNDVYVISSSVTIRVAYDSYARYKYAFTPSDFTGYSDVAGASMSYIEVPVSDTRWTMTVAYANDEETKVTITCINDADPPKVTATATVPVLEFFETQNYGNVLYAVDKATREVVFHSSARAQAEKVVFSWDDGEGSGVEAVSYTLNGGETRRINPKETDYFSVITPGEYAVSVTDLLGNTTELSFTLTDEPKATFTLADGTPITPAADPTACIQGSGANAVFTQTDYTGKEFSILLSEEADLVFRREVEGSSVIAKMQYRAGQMEWFVYHENTGYESVGGVLTDQAPSGVFMDLGYSIRYNHDKHGLLLTFPDNHLALESFQFRVTDTAATCARVVQLERSDRLPVPVPVKADSGTPVNATADAFTGINEGFTFAGDASDIIDVTAYRSEKYTMDFSYVSEKNTYQMLNVQPSGSLIGTIKDEGYYKVVITNKYGNASTYLLRVNFGSDIEVILTYEDFDPIERTIKGGGTYHFYTNDRIVIRIWDTETKRTVEKDGSLYNPPTRAENGCVEMTFDVVGAYVITVTDEFGTAFELKLDVRDPVTLAYGEYLTGFNEDAVLRAEQHTNKPLGLSKSALDDAAIAHVSYRPKSESAWIVVYDILSETPVGESGQNLNDCIGQGDGTYTVRFADRYGNVCTTEVYISSKVQLAVSRNTKNSAGNVDYAVDAILSTGVWSNYIVRLQNQAPAARLFVDGTEVAFNERGEYILELPLSKGDNAEATHTVLYIDDCGNRCEFTVYLLRKTPEVQERTEGEALVQGGTLYVKGSFGFEWSDPEIMATYTKNGESGFVYLSGQTLEEDGTYNFTFTDKAGNMETRRIIRDTVVVYELVRDGGDAADGIAVAGYIRIDENGETITIVEALRDGEAYIPQSHTFSEHGSYVVTLADEVGNRATVTFDIFRRPVQAFTYITKGEYALYQVWYYTDGVRQPANGILLGDDGRQEFGFWEDGLYEVDLLHMPTNTYVTFPLEVDNLAPEVTLIGVEEGGTTRETVSFEGLAGGDTVEIWIDGELSRVVNIGSVGSDSPLLREAGEYKVIIRDEAGNETTYTFVREFTANTASNIFICLLLFMGGIGSALILHGRGRVRVK